MSEPVSKVNGRGKKLGHCETLQDIQEMLKPGIILLFQQDVSIVSICPVFSPNFAFSL